MPAIVIVGAQWGDEGKGKITDYLASDADMVVRYQGGANAGHTVRVGDEEFKFHLLPSGLLSRKASVIGNGVVLDAEIITREIAELHEKGYSTDTLYISDRAHLIMPYHKKLDEVEEARRGPGEIGTTRRGIGPAYTDKAAREGIRLGTMADPALFAARIRDGLARANLLLERLYGVEGFDEGEVIQEYLGYAETLRPYLRDTSRVINQVLDEGKKVVFEGAQGTMLDLDHGTYPYVTSSHPIAGGACIGAGVGPTRINGVFGIAKAYTSRVGGGPFPTELTGALGDQLRTQGHEFGTTTGRPRRCGWLDSLVLNYAVRVNGLSGFALTRLDTLGGFDTVRIGVGYRHNREITRELPHDIHLLETATPVYEEMPGWPMSISDVRDFDELPAPARNYVLRLEELTGTPIPLISVGPERSQTIKRGSVF